MKGVHLCGPLLLTNKAKHWPIQKKGKKTIYIVRWVCLFFLRPQCDCDQAADYESVGPCMRLPNADDAPLSVELQLGSLGISSYTTSHLPPTQSMRNCKKAKTKNTTSQLHKAHQLIFHKLSSTKQTQEASCSRAIWMGCLPTLLITRRMCRWTHPHPYHTPYACVLSSRARKNKLLLETQGVK